MVRFESRLKNVAWLVYRWMSSVCDPIRAARGATGLCRYLRDWIRYSRREGAERIRLIDTYPCVHDRTATTHFDRHYFYQDIWAFKKIYKSSIECHVDVGSRIDLVGFLTAITKVIFVDIRPVIVDLENFESRAGDITRLPFDDGSVQSLSCLHVAEHIGLGRYGDAVDPYGTEKACRELVRILRPGGNLYFSVPVGKPRLCFNAHRIHSPRQIVQLFEGLELVEFSGIDDNKKFLSNVSVEVMDDCAYGCGLFHFRKQR